MSGFSSEPFVARFDVYRKPSPKGEGFFLPAFQYKAKYIQFRFQQIKKVTFKPRININKFSPAFVSFLNIP